MPARRSGNSAHHAASHRLWARRPGEPAAELLGAAARATSSPPFGKNGGTVFG